MEDGLSFRVAALPKKPELRILLQRSTEVGQVDRCLPALCIALHAPYMILDGVAFFEQRGIWNSSHPLHNFFGIATLHRPADTSSFRLWWRVLS